MEFGLKNRLGHWIAHWLAKESLHANPDARLYDFDRLCYEIRPGDVILVEGRSRVSNVIKMITQSPWTHSALYIGRLYDIDDEGLRETIAQHYSGDPNDQLIIEALLGEGTVIHPVTKYQLEHLRICRPNGLSPADAQRVIAFAIERLGADYDIRQLLDLARFLFPYGILPRRWASSLFRHNAGAPTRTVCSTMLAEAFQSVSFPVLPFAEKTAAGKIHLYRRNPRLYSPSDFDFSPYFDIIKYPFLGVEDLAIYRQLPWHHEDVFCNELDDCYLNPDLRPRNDSPNTGPRVKPVAVSNITNRINLLSQFKALSKEQI